VATFFRLKISFSGRGALAGTRWAHLNCNNKRTKGSAGVEVPREISITTKNTEQPKFIEMMVTDKFLGTLVGSIGSSRAGGHE
jgi:hypothetical protein